MTDETKASPATDVPRSITGCECGMICAKSPRCDDQHVSEHALGCPVRMSEREKLARISADATARAEQDKTIKALMERVEELEDMYRTFSLAAGDEYTKALLRIADLEDRLKGALSALRELAATVRGEAPMLLNEDSGGNGVLSLEIDRLLLGVPKTLWQTPESAPDATYVLLLVPNYGVNVGLLTRHPTGDRWFIRGSDNEAVRPSHWMPIPALPDDDRARLLSAGVVETLEVKK